MKPAVGKVLLKAPLVVVALFVLCLGASFAFDGPGAGDVAPADDAPACGYRTRAVIAAAAGAESTAGRCARCERSLRRSGCAR